MTDQIMEECSTMLASALEYVGEQLNPKNSFGQTVGDELNNIGFQFSRIADALEKIANK